MSEKQRGTMDNRRKQTNETIKKAFVSISEKKAPQLITVKELCQKANINRSTFYDHYVYMENLIREIIRDQTIIITENANKEHLDSIPLSNIPREIIRNYIHEYMNNKIIQRFVNNDDGFYVSILIDEQVKQTLRMVENNNNFYYYAFFQNAGATALIIRWIKEKYPVPEETIIDIIESYSNSMHCL